MSDGGQRATIRAGITDLEDLPEDLRREVEEMLAKHPVASSKRVARRLELATVVPLASADRGLRRETVARPVAGPLGTGSGPWSTM